MKKSYLLITTLLLIQYTGNASAIDYFVMDFEDGKQPVSTPSPSWSLPANFAETYGPGNFFNVTNSTAHSGSYSLRFTYEARNGQCNTCGVTTLAHKSDLNNVNYFVADTGQDLTLADGAAAAVGRIVYNKTNGFSTWEIVSIGNEVATNDKLMLKPLSAGITNATAEFNGNDDVQIARQCGVDGTIGGKDNNRRSDCNIVIHWFENIPVGVQNPGDSIFRRQYLKAEVTSPLIHQKLHYFKPDHGGPNTKNVIMFADSLNTSELIPVLTGLDKYGAKSLYEPGRNGVPASLTLERGVWYYIEEQYKAATQDLVTDPTGNTYNTDGEYRMWISKSGEEDTVGATPIIELTNITMPPIRGGGGLHMSFWGNIQHWVHTRGSWYLDDYVISNAKIGKATGGNTDIAPPSSPNTN